MNVYRVSDIKDDSDLSSVFFRHTLAAAHAEAKGQYSDEVKPDVRLELIEIETNREAVIGYLNGEKVKGVQILRTWKLTPRGGLVELDRHTDKPLENT